LVAEFLQGGVFGGDVVEDGRFHVVVVHVDVFV
jgi:hypothetical protein